MPTVSVILPTYNRLRYLRPAIESVYAQSFVDWELIIADDGSTGDTRSFLEGLQSAGDPRVRTVWLSHCGNPSRVRNAAVEIARGRYLAFLDSDDTWMDSKLEKQVSAHRADPNRRWSYTAFTRVDEQGRPLGESGPSPRTLRDGWIVDHLLRLDAVMAMPTVMADRGLVLEIGAFDESLRFGEYHDLCLRLAMRSPVLALCEPLCAVRSHDEHYSHDRIGDYAGWVRLYGKMADLAPDTHLAAHCRRRRALTSVILAGLLGDRGRYASVWTTLASAAPFSWHYPEWWFGAAKAVARPLVPARVLSAYRELRR
jgi:glycosyltransferase involved in cell wall biosynthesis